MGVRRFAGCVAVALCAVWPASAAATIDGIALRPSGFADFLCLGSTSTAPVGLRLAAPDGSILQTLLLPTADDLGDAGCPASTHTFEPGASLPAGALQPAFNRYPAGGRITATQDGRSVTFALPYGAFSAGTTRLRALPNPAALTGGVVDPSAPGTYDGPAATEGAPVSISGSVLDSSSAPVPITETVTPRQYRVELESTFIQVLGADPLGGTLAATLSGPGGSTVGRATLRPRVGGDCTLQCSASSSFDSPAPPGGTLAVSGQPGWFGARSITLPQASLRPDGFDVSIPGGDTGNYDFGLRFFDPETISSLAPTSPLRCLALGSAVSCSGGAPASRLSASAGGLFVVPGDSVDVTATEADGDSASVSATAGGLSGSLDDGSLIVRGAPRALVLAALRSPRAAPLAPFVATHSDRTDASGTATLEDSFAVHIQNGAVATLSGPATGPTAQTFTWDLVASVGASGVVSGTTYANARVAVDHEQGGRTEHLETTANAAGAFSVTLSDPRLGDVVRIAAAEPATRQMTTTSTAVGALTPSITGVSDGQFVRGTVTPTVAGTGLDSVLWNGLSEVGLPSLLATAPPFPYPIDTTRWPDGPYRLEVSGRPAPSAEDYLYVNVDNTPPTGGAGADQTVAKGRTAVIVTGAADATSGLASVKVDFGDNHRQSLPVAKLANPITHAYSKLGTFTVAVTITDRAGNVTSDTARIRVASTVTPSVSGHFPGKLVRKRLLAAKLVGHAAGQLEIFVLGQGGGRKLTKLVTFTKANQRIKVSLATRGLKVGRFLVVEQFTDANGVAGPVQAQALRVTKAVVKKKK